jgi:hypothetical protein
MRRLAAPLMLACLVPAAPALAQEQAPAQDPAPGPGGDDQATPVGGSLALRVRSGVSDSGRAYVAPGQRVEVRGVVSRFAPLQQVTVEVTRGGRRVGSSRVLVRKAGRRGAFTYRFGARRSGRYLVRVRHAATGQRAFGATVSVRAVSFSAEPGASGLRVRLLQRGLARLAFATSRGGRYDAATGRAVLAFRKTNGMPRTTTASARMISMLLRGQGGFRLKYPDHGKHVEADLSRQVVVLARRGRPERIYTTSSGAPATPTVLGSFRFYLKARGTNAKGMVHSSYFLRGYAIHGYASVPPYPASHGCLRVPIPNAAQIFDWIRIGDRIDVYR